MVFYFLVSVVFDIYFTRLPLYKILIVVSFSGDSLFTIEFIKDLIVKKYENIPIPNY